MVLYKLGGGRLNSTEGKNLKLGLFHYRGGDYFGGQRRLTLMLRPDGVTLIFNGGEIGAGSTFLKSLFENFDEGLPQCYDVFRTGKGSGYYSSNNQDMN